MIRDSVKVSELTLEAATSSRQRLSAMVDNELVWFDFPESLELEKRGDIFIAMALLEAMISNLPIVLTDDIPVSPLLLQRLDELQGVYCCWNHELSKVEVRGGFVEPSTSNDYVASFYSGGIDGGYSFCKNKQEITHLITMSGFDTTDKPKQWASLIEKNKQLAISCKVELIDIDNNIRSFISKRKITNAFQHGLTLAGISISLGFKKVFIPSTFTYSDLFPWGSHPVTDPLWSTENRQVIHCGSDVSRSEKIKLIAENIEVLNNLQVCWENIDFNCGVCSKCLRTKAALYIFDVNSTALSELTNVKDLKRLTISGQAGLPFMQDLVTNAKKLDKPEVAKILKKNIRSYLIKYYVEGLIKTLVGGKIKAFIHKAKGTAWHAHRVSMQGKSE